jgi:hypothetical protein
MTNQHANHNKARPLDELSPDLRQAIEGLLQEPPPEGLMQRALDLARRQATTEPSRRPRPADRWREHRAKPWSFATAASIAIAACTLVLLLLSSFVSRMPDCKVIPQMPAAIGQDLPTAWAYHRAIAQSPEAMDSLLARHARRILRPEAKHCMAQVSRNSLQPMP